MYQVGFGDCFLVSFEYAAQLDDGRSERHVLFDFGSTHAPRAPVKSLLPNVAKLIEAHCGGQLDVLVATHRHKDHIDGFGNKDAAKVISRLKPKLVVRPWTEDPKLPADSKALGVGAAPSERFAASLGEAQGFAELTKSLVSQNGRRPRGIAGDLVELAANQVPNQAALDHLNSWADAGDLEFLHAGVKTKIPKFVPGITVRVLGPRSNKSLTLFASAPMTTSSGSLSGPCSRAARGRSTPSSTPHPRRKSWSRQAAQSAGCSSAWIASAWLRCCVSCIRWTPPSTTRASSS
jgi:hypothetical protein